MILAVESIETNATAGLQQTDRALSGAAGQLIQAVATLSDGWYSVQARLDPHLARYACDGRIRPGDKLRVSCAQLVGGVARIQPATAPPGE